MAARRWSLDGRTALVTGAGRGIGAEVARRLVARGMTVAVVDIEPAGAERVAAELGDRAAWWTADIARPEQIGAAVDGAVERFGGLDAVVANAAVAEFGLVESFDPAGFERVVDVTLMGTWRTLRAALPDLIARRGYALCVSSMAGVIQGPLNAPYAAAKGGVQALANALRTEVEPAGVRVGLAYLGFIGSPGGLQGRADPAMAPIFERLPRRFVRLAAVEDTAEALAGAVERRARTVVFPRSYAGAIRLFELPQRLGDRMFRRRAIGDAVRRAHAPPPA